MSKRKLTLLSDMALFVEVARRKSFTEAGISLGVPAATLSRRLSLMEQEVGVKLLNRTTRKVELTEAGSTYFKKCEPLVDGAFSAQLALEQIVSSPSGHIRLTAPVDFALYYLAPLLSDCATLYPAISFGTDLSAQNIDLITHKIDFAIRLGTVKDQQLFIRKLGVIHFKLYASLEYLEKFGTPLRPSELRSHQCLIGGGTQNKDKWIFESNGVFEEVDVQGRFAANNLSFLRTLSEQGQGVVGLPYLIAKEGLEKNLLAPILENWTMQKIPVSAVMPSSLRPASVNLILDYLQEKLNSL
ncbi:MAG: LysR family transcriptional regulator [SAR324 cluster bacterium]|nr:LysR family transcriptional regulator [SAR324 cluster bacterium]